MFNNNPANGTVIPGNYVSQGMTGVRFFYALGGGGGNSQGTSTPFLATHAIDPNWIAKLRQLFTDLHTWGIQRITPLPVLDATWGSNPAPSPLSASYLTNPGCPSGSVTLYFLPWLPYGLKYHPGYSDNGFPDGQGDPQAYNCRPKPPASVFWGWSYIIGSGGLIDQVLGAAQAAGITVQEAEILNEGNLQDFNVEARVIYDNTTGTAVSQTIGQLMANHGFSSTAVTMSVQQSRPCRIPVPGAPACVSDCLSLYGDSAQITMTDELQSAFYGGVFGQIPHIAWNGAMPCDGSTAAGCGSVGSPGWYACATMGMITLPGSHSTPTVTDIHATPCLLIASGTSYICDTSGAVSVAAAATALYNDVWGYLQYRGLTANPVFFGETSSNQASTSCNNDTPVMTIQNASGYIASSLFVHDAANVHLRPWDNSRSTTCVTPTALGAPSGPYAP